FRRPRRGRYNRVMNWLAPWHPIGDTTQVEGIQKELRRELSPGHPLYAIPTRAIARREDCDDVLFSTNDGTGRVAVVHLTRTASEKPPWPDTVVWNSLDEWMTTGMRSDNQELEAEQS